MLPIKRREALAAACLYLVCDELADEFLRAALTGGVDLVQLRIKSAGDKRLVTVCRRYASTCSEYGVPLILNDRPDLVEAGGADGVHIGQDDLPVGAARAIVGAERLVGLSTHSPEQIDAAAELDVDYIGVGPVHATPTKPGRPAVGPELVSYAAAHARTPFFAIGGIDSSNIAAVAAAGARRVAVVRALTRASDPERAALALRAAIEREAGVGAG